MTPKWRSVKCILTAFIGVLLISQDVVAPNNARADSPTSDEVASSDAIFDGIVTLVRMRHKDDVARDAALMDALDNTLQKMLRALDHDDSRQALRNLTRLNYYYLGEATDQTLECVIVRKSTRIIPLLELARNHDVNDCPRSIGADNSICYPDDKAKDGFEALILRIKHNEHCEIEE